MTMDRSSDERTAALADFHDGFTAGRNGHPREKGRSGLYRRSWARGRQAAIDADERAAFRLMREAKGAVA